MERLICVLATEERWSQFFTLSFAVVAKRVGECWDIHFDENGQELYDVSDVALQILDKRTVRDLEMCFGVAWSI